MSVINSYLELIKKFNNEVINNYIDIINSLNKKDKLEILIAGELSNGKSTFLNIFLKRDLLPTGIGATTAKITYIQQDSSDYLLSDDKRYDLDLNSSDLEIKNQIEEVMKNNRDNKVYLYLKEFPFDDIIFIDTPGVNDINRERELLTYQYAPFSDVVIFVADISKGLSSLEKNFFDKIDDSMKDKIFILFNKIDTIREYDDNQPQIYLNELKITNIKSYGVSCYQAFQAIQDSDKELTDISNIETFLDDLIRYISTIDKKRAIDARRDKLLKRVNSLAKIQIKSLISNYDKDINSLEKEYEDIQTKLDKATQLYNQKNEELNQTILEMKLEIKSNIVNFKDEIQNNLNNCEYIDEKIEYLESQEFRNLCEDFSTKIKTTSLSYNENIKKIEVDFIDSMLIKLDDSMLLFLIQIFPIKHPAIKIAIPFIKKAIEFVSKNRLESKVNDYIDSIFKELNEKVELSFDGLDESISFELRREVDEIKTQKLSLEQNLDNQRNILEVKKLSKEHFIQLKESIKKTYKEIKNVG